MTGSEPPKFKSWAEETHYNFTNYEGLIYIHGTSPQCYVWSCPNCDNTIDDRIEPWQFKDYDFDQYECSNCKTPMTVNVEKTNIARQWAMGT